MIHYSVCLQGKTRENCEDNLSSAVSKDDKIKFYIVSDGMGGHEAGEVASQIVVTELSKTFSEYEYDSPEGLEEFLKNAVEKTDEKIKEEQNPLTKYKMGATLVAVAVIPDEKKAVFINVGDSRGFVINDGKTVFETREDTVAQEMRDNGYTELSIRYNPDSQLITKAMGMLQDDQEPTITNLEIGEQDVFLLCSDGLSDYLPLNEIVEIVQENGVSQETCEKLADAAMDAGSNDDITITLVKIG